MFGSGILEIAIGLVFVFLVTSLIITATSELIASWLRWRAKNLEEGIRNLLHPRSSKTDTVAHDITQKIYDHPLVNSLSMPGRKPSYIPSRTFALSLLDALAELSDKAPKAKEDLKGFIDSIPDPNLKKALTSLYEEAGQDLERLKTYIEIWFNNSMDRVSGWYKRKTQFVHVLLGIIFAFALNVDTLLIAKTIANDSALRASLVAQAEAVTKEGLPQSGGAASVKEAQAAVKESIDKLGGLGLPIGWTNDKPEGYRKWPGWWPGQKRDDAGNLVVGADGKPAYLTWKEFNDAWGDTLRFHIIGWLLTAFATSLGAPFWFDLLNRFINLRAVGKAPEEKPKDPKKEPQPRGPGETPEDQRRKIEEDIRND
jgi:hypothetical protein